MSHAVQARRDHAPTRWIGRALFATAVVVVIGVAATIVLGVWQTPPGAGATNVNAAVSRADAGLAKQEVSNLAVEILYLTTENPVGFPAITGNGQDVLLTWSYGPTESYTLAAPVEWGGATATGTDEWCVWVTIHDAPFRYVSGPGRGLEDGYCA